MKFNLFSDGLETKFWNYFVSHVDNSDSLLHSAQLLKSVNDKLNEYFPGLGLGCLATFTGGKKVSQIYITAFGDKTKFPTIEKLVKKSPKTDKYNIFSFAPPSFLRDSLTFDGKSIPTDNIQFTYKRNNNELDISLFFPDKPSKSDVHFSYAFQTLMFEFLGEIQFSKLGTVDILSADKKPTGQLTEKLKLLYKVMTTEFPQ
ncbi:MAG TPA: hypothetical protein VK772_00795 [Puia sp.]|nr:hypothetical protein [Puia sp.]